MTSTAGDLPVTSGTCGYHPMPDDAVDLAAALGLVGRHLDRHRLRVGSDEVGSITVNHGNDDLHMGLALARREIVRSS